MFDYISDWYFQLRSHVLRFVSERYVRLPLLWSVVLALPFIVLFKEHPIGPSSLVTTLVVAFFGTIVLSSVVFDVAKRIAAKRKLGIMLLQLSESDLIYFRYARLDPSGIYRYDFDFRGDRDYRKQSLPLLNLLMFLDSEPLGSIASQALFQRPPAGRARYLERAMRLAKNARVYG